MVPGRRANQLLGACCCEALGVFDPRDVLGFEKGSFGHFAIQYLNWKQSYKATLAGLGVLDMALEGWDDVYHVTDRQGRDFPAGEF